MTYNMLSCDTSMAGATVLAKCLRHRALLLAMLLGLLVSNGGAAADGATEQNLGDLSAKLSNPLSDVWALFLEIDDIWLDGKIVDGHKKSSAVIFQPIMPFRLTETWKMITRPVVPLLIGNPTPDGIKPDGSVSFEHNTGLGDIAIPLIFTPNEKKGQHLMLGAGPTFQFPTHTTNVLGTDTWEAGPALVATYKTKKTVTGAFGQYWWSYAKGDNEPNTSHGSILYFAFYSLPNAWQIGTSPTITYNDKATSGNKWNVPLGLTVTKTTKIGKQPIKLQLAIEKSVTRQDDFGKDWMLRLNIIPVIPAMVKNPIFK